MIDTDKYEGHTPAPWEWPEEDSILLKGKYEKYIITGRHLSGDSIDEEADAALIADAPLLLEAYKRLRDHIRRMRHWAEPKMHEVHHDAWRKLHEEIYEGGEEE